MADREIPSPKVLDWRRPEDYGYAASLTLHEWAWEFARRSPLYRLLWERRQELHVWLSGQPKPDEKAIQKVFQEYSRRSGPISTELYEKIGMNQAPDPRKNALEVEQLPFLARVDVTPTFFLGQGPTPNRKTQPWPGYPRHVNIQFDLLIPAVVQAEECRRIILGKQKELIKRKLLESIPVPPRRKPPTTHFVTHIRLLDARAEGASYRLMGRILFPSAGDPRNSAKSMLEAATAMSEQGFRDLLMFPELP